MEATKTADKSSVNSVVTHLARRRVNSRSSRPCAMWEVYQWAGEWGGGNFELVIGDRGCALHLCFEIDE